MVEFPWSVLARRALSVVFIVFLTMQLVGCAKPGDEASPGEGDVTAKATARLSTADPPMLNILPASGECEPYKQEKLAEPATIHPVDGVLETQLIVALKERCVPVFDSESKTWSNKILALRTYGFPRDHADPITAEEVQASLVDENMVWSAPGPTLMLEKATAPGRNDGTNLKFTLYNVLEPQADPHACNELHKRKEGEFNGPFTPDTSPNCFHGDNSTNFHFHGSHVSPQEHQDFVGLELLPFGATAPEHAVHTRGTVAIGEYPFDFDRLRYTQAEGTHWYHAHKHGSTALQVLNGLVGTALIFGEFDEELETFFENQPQGGLEDHLLVVQQLEELPPGLGAEDTTPAEPLINGQANPILQMKPGEIQRWRFVGATMQASAKLEIGFKAGPDGNRPEVRQIAMDGVQFAPANYECQPILRGPDCQLGTADDSFKELGDFNLDPGNRIDILIKAPPEPGTYTMTFDMSMEGLHEDVVAEMRVFLGALAEATGADEPALLTLVVDPGEDLGTEFPSEEQFPALPDYLADLEGPFVEREVGYEMKNRGELTRVHFSINGTQYDPSCANETLTLDVEEEWTLTNNSSIAHPFHIHTNPFQLVSELRYDSDGKPLELVYQAPYVWRDTVAIPTFSTVNAEDFGEAKIRYVAREFTGEFVNHCHILGHEDRGMMHNVQATCPNGQWGKPTSDLSPECVDGNYRDAAPKCDE